MKSSIILALLFVAAVLAPARGAEISTTTKVWVQINAVDHAYPIYPNLLLTPGVTEQGVGAKDICTPGYTAKVRNVSWQTKMAVFKRYGIKFEPGKYEVDHLVSLELGGSNDILNLWPEPYAGTYGARQKDVVENFLHRQVCQGKITLQEAQDQIIGDWVAVYLLKAK